MRTANIYMHNSLAGKLIENEEGYSFQYLPAYLEQTTAEQVSLTLPLQTETFTSPTLFPFFDGLIPEGWLLEIAEKNWKLNIRDRMGLLLQTCHDCIGAARVEPASDE